MLLSSNKPFSQLSKSKGLTTWDELVEFIAYLPYGRNSNRTDFSLVITEQKGTCSSKHALLKAVADENNLPVKLILGLYKMNQLNTPSIGSVLKDNNLNYIPEAHCYLKIDNKRLDYTSNSSSFSNISSDLIEEKEIGAYQVTSYKVKYHKSFIQKWIIEEKMDLTFEEVWQVRETCIQNIENKKK